MESSNLSGHQGGGSYPGQPSSCEVTLLNQLNERRDSTTSTISSAYTVSRRSSGISPCYSSRRSSEASQFGTNRHNNISSADSYDPISTDLSRRSSEASQCGGGGGFGGGANGGGGLPSLLSLTPAQHYRLKAKYAAATGGAPPTPLPNMERMSLRTRMALYGDSQDGPPPPPPLRHPNLGTVPRRCSDIGYSGRSLLPHEVPAHLPRRASDPVRRPSALDPPPFPRMQRYGSTNSVNPGGHQGASLQQGCSHQGALQHGWSRSDGSLQRYPFAPRPPSISENVAMENMAMDGGEDDMMLPDDVVQYLRAQSHGYLDRPTQGFQTQPPPFYSQRRMAVADGAMNQPGQNHFALAASSASSKSNMPVQWNEVSSGTVDASSKLARPQQQQQQLRGNLALVQQRQNFGPFQAQSLNANQQVAPMSQNMAMQGYVNHGSQRPMNGTHQHQTQQQNQRQCNNLTFSDVHMSPQQGFGQEAVPNSMSGSTSMRPPHNGIANGQVQGHRGHRMAVDGGYPHFGPADLQQNYSVLSHQQQNQNQHSRGGATFQPRPPTEPKSASGRQILGQPTRTPKSLDLSPYHGTGTSEASPKRPSGTATQNPNSSAPFSFHQSHYDEPMSPCGGQAPTGDPSVAAAAAASMASPGVNLVSSSTTDSSSGGANEHVQIDFDTMLDDGDHSSLMSGTLSPGLLQNLSQNSSRLTTPRNSVTLASVPAGIGNMAIGDMNSMLTALAEESKFLNMMS